jgi:hypothetical protein
MWGGSRGEAGSIEPLSMWGGFHGESGSIEPWTRRPRRSPVRHVGEPRSRAGMPEVSLRSLPDADRASSCYLETTSVTRLKTCERTRRNSNALTEDARQNRFARLHP